MILPKPGWGSYARDTVLPWARHYPYGRRASSAAVSGGAWGVRHKRGLLVGGGAGVIGLGVEAHRKSSGRNNMYNGY